MKDMKKSKKRMENNFQKLATTDKKKPCKYNNNLITKMINKK